MNSKIGGAYVTELVNTVPTAAHVQEYAHIIKDAAIRRSLNHIGTELAEDGFQDEKETRNILDKAESAGISISQGQQVKGFIQIKETLAESFDRIDEIHKKGVGFRGIPSGFQDLDNLLSGFQASNLIILAARPGQGKTAMVINIAQNISVE